jgi:small subunit ribosomal protein S8
VQTDPIADLLARVRNANRALHDRVELPTSRMKEEIARLLKEEGYIRDYHVVGPEEWNRGRDERQHRSYGTLVIELKYGPRRERIITDLKRVSRPGRRIYAGRDDLPRVMGGMGVAIVSTSRGVITARDAEREGIGGEVICHIW